MFVLVAISDGDDIGIGILILEIFVDDDKNSDTFVDSNEGFNCADVGENGSGNANHLKHL